MATRRWRAGAWYALCLEHFAAHHAEGGYCDVMQRDRLRCSFCPGRAVAEFYPRKGLVRRIGPSRK